MKTGTSKANFFSKRLITTTSMKDNLLEYLEEGQLRTFKMVTTGQSTTDDHGAFFQATEATDGTAGSTLSFPSLYGTDGTGNVIDLGIGESTIHTPYFIDVPFEDTSATTYHLGVKVVSVPKGIAYDTSTGIRNYDSYMKTLGQVQTVNGASYDSTLNQLTVTFAASNANDDFTGRTVTVWLDTPSSSDAGVAIKTGTITKSGPNHQFVISGSLGQSVPSTTVSDYNLVILGPIITETDIRPSNVAGRGIAYIGNVIGGTAPRTFDHSEQIEIEPLANQQGHLQKLVSNGWIVSPTVVNNTTTIDITTTNGVAFINGVSYTVATSSYSPSGVGLSTGHYFLTWSNATGLGTLSATDSNYVSAQSGNVCLVGLFHYDASSNQVTNFMTAFRLLKDFDRHIRMVISTSGIETGSFDSLSSALATAVVISKRTSNDVSFTIEVAGMVPCSCVNDTQQLLVPNVHFVGRGTARGVSYKIQRADTAAGQGESYYGFKNHVGTMAKNNSGFSFNITNSDKAGFHFEIDPVATGLPTFEGKTVSNPFPGWTFDNIVMTSSTGSGTNEPKSFFYVNLTNSASQNTFANLDVMFRNCEFIGSSHEPSATARTMGRVAYVMIIHSFGGTIGNYTELDSDAKIKDDYLGRSHVSFINCGAVMDYGLIYGVNTSSATNEDTGSMSIYAKNCSIIATGNTVTAAQSYTGKMAVFHILNKQGAGTAMSMCTFEDNEYLVVPENHASGTAALEAQPFGMGFIHAVGTTREVTIKNNKMTGYRAENMIPMVGLAVNQHGSSPVGQRAYRSHIIGNSILYLQATMGSVSEDTASNAEDWGAIKLTSRSSGASLSTNVGHLGGSNKIVDNTIRVGRTVGDIPSTGSSRDYAGIQVDCGDVCGAFINGNDIVAASCVRFKHDNYLFVNIHVYNNTLSCTYHGIIETSSSTTMPAGDFGGSQINNNVIYLSASHVGSFAPTGIRNTAANTVIGGNTIFLDHPPNTGSSGGFVAISSIGRNCIIKGNVARSSDLDLTPAGAIEYGDETIVMGNNVHKTVKKATSAAYTDCIIVGNVWTRQRDEDDFNNMSRVVYSSNVIKVGSQADYGFEYGTAVQDCQFDHNVVRGGFSAHNGALDASNLWVSSVIGGNIFQPSGGSAPIASVDFNGNKSSFFGNVCASGSSDTQDERYIRMAGTHVTASSNVSTFLTSWRSASTQSSVDPDYMNKSVISANVLWKGIGDKFASSNNYPHLHVDQSVLVGNFAGSDGTSIEAPRNEQSGDGTGYLATGGNVSVAGNVSLGDFSLQLINSSLSGNVLTADRFSQGFISELTFPDQFSFSVANSGSAGGSVHSEKLSLTGNVMAGPFLSTSNVFTLTGNITHRFSQITYSSVTYQASYYLDGTNSVAVANLGDQGMYIDNSITPSTLADLGLFTTGIGGKINVSF